MRWVMSKRIRSSVGTAKDSNCSGAGSQTDGQTPPADGPTTTHPTDGRRESDLGEERIANESKLKLGIRVSPRTVEKHLRNGGPVRTPDPEQRWLTFVHNHAKVIVACDFFVVVTASFRTLYVFVIMELSSRRILHHNVTAHPTAERRSSILVRDPRPG